MPNVRIRTVDFTIVMAALRASLWYEMGRRNVLPRRFARNFVMTDDPSSPSADPAGAARKPLTPAAQRALAEAEERRKAAAASATPAPKEHGGPKGPEPTRYGDWERKGIASDF